MIRTCMECPKSKVPSYSHVEVDHHPTQKVDVIQTLATGEIRISDTDHLEHKLDHLNEVFNRNGYHKDLIKKAIQEAKSIHHKHEVPTPKLTLPYIKGTTDKIAKILKRRSIHVAFAPSNTIIGFVGLAKDPLDPGQQKGVYSIPCSCSVNYIRETGRSMQVCIKEHSADIAHNRVTKLALAEHSHKTTHLICMGEAKLIAKEEHYVK